MSSLLNCSSPTRDDDPHVDDQVCAKAVGTPDVSVVIVSWNTAEMTHDCVRSVLQHCIKNDVEVIVVDNASADETVATLKSEFPTIRVVRNAENKGFARANNDGFCLARGRYVLLLNSDTVVHDDVIAATVEFADRNPGIGVVGCRALDVDGHQQSTMFRFLTLPLLIWNLLIPVRWLQQSRWFGNRRYAGLDVNQTHDVDVVTGCFMLVRQEVLATCGGLDPEFFMYGEEMEWCFRIRKAGWRVTYFPDARYTHFGGVSSSKCQSQMNVEMARGQLLFMLKVYGTGTARIAAMLMLLRDLPRAFAWTLLSLLPWLRRSRIRHATGMSVERLPFLGRVVVTSDLKTVLVRSHARSGSNKS